MAIALADTRSDESALSRRLDYAARGALWCAVLLLVLYPLLMVVAATAFPAMVGAQPLNLAELFTDRLLQAAFNTLRLGLSVSLLSVLFGSAAALLAARSQRSGVVDLLMSLPFLTPPFLASLAWGLAVGGYGYLGRMGLPGEFFDRLIFSFAGLSLLMACHYTPMVYFAARAQIVKVPSSLLWAARISGATSAVMVRRILLPTIFPALLAGGFLAFAASIEEYGTPLIVGNRIGFPVISTEIARLVRVYPINLTLASGLAAILMALTAGIYGASQLLQTHSTGAGKISAHPMPDLLPRSLRGPLWLLIFVYTVFAVVIPYASMLLTSILKLVSAGLTPANLTLTHYGTALAQGSNGLRDAVVASFSLAVMAAALGTVLGVGCAREGSILASLGLIPVAIPAITMALGYIRAWNAPWVAAWPLYGSVAIVGLFYSAQYLPYAIQYARAGAATIPQSYEWAARIHGAGRGAAVARIVAPLLWPHCLAGAILIFSISFRELVGSVLLRPPGMETVSTFILHEFDQGSPADGMALGVIAISISLLSVSLARRLVPRQR